MKIVLSMITNGTSKSLSDLIVSIYKSLSDIGICWDFDIYWRAKLYKNPVPGQELRGVIGADSLNAAIHLGKT